MDRGNLRDQINRILFHVLSNEERADKIAELIAPELKKARKYDALVEPAYRVAMFLLQSPFYKDPDVKAEVDSAIALTIRDAITGKEAKGA